MFKRTTKNPQKVCKLNVNWKNVSCKLSLHQFTYSNIYIKNIVNYVNSVYISVYMKVVYIYNILSTRNKYIYGVSFHSLHDLTIFFQNLTRKPKYINIFVVLCCFYGLSSMGVFLYVLVFFCVRNLVGFESSLKNHVNCVN